MKGMKASRIILATAVAALAFTACQKSEPVQSSAKTIKFVAGETATKAAFGPKVEKSYPVSWTENDTQFAIVFNNATSKEVADVTVSNGIASCEYDLPDGATEFQFSVVSPAAGLVGNSSNKGLNFKVPTSQTPIEGSVDEAALLLYAVTDKYAAEDLPELPIKLEFNHFTAYGNVSIVGLNKEITAIDMTAEENWAGNWNYNTTTGDLLANAPSKTISLATTSLTDNWFACAPVDLGGKTIKFSVTTTDGIYQKTITIPEGKKFESGKIAKFSVDFTGVKPKDDVIYTLVTDSGDLTVGSQIIFVALDSDYAMAAQKSNNRDQAAIVKTENTIVNPSEAVAVFTLEPGKITGTGAFSSSDGYLYAASSSSNYLKSQSAIDDNASFTVTIADNGSAEVKARGANTRNVLRYNSASGLFSCYASGQQDIAIYKKNGTGTDTPIFVDVVVPVFANLADLVAADVEDGTTVTVTVNDVIDSFYVSSKGYRNGVYVMVGDQKIEIYCNNVPESWVAGGTISGTVTCAWTYFERDSQWELTPSSWDAFTYTAPTGGEGDDEGDDEGGETTAGTYTLVTDASTLKDGDVIILGYAAENVVDGPVGTGKFFTAVAGTFADNTVTATGAAEITLGASDGAWTLTTDEGTIGTKAAKAINVTGEGTTTWTISIEDGVATVASTNSAYGRFLYNVSSPRFLNYTSNTSASMVLPSIYKK